MTTAKDLAGLVGEVRKGSTQQRAEARKAIPATAEGSALSNVLGVLEQLGEWLPFLSEQQRVSLATGRVGELRTLEAEELESLIFAAWWRAEDRDAFDLRVQVLLADGVLRPRSRRLLEAVRAGGWRNG